MVAPSRLLAADGAKVNRRFVSLAEQLHRHIDLTDIDEPARPQLNVRVSLVIELQSRVVFDARGQVAPMRRWNSLARSFLEIQGSKASQVQTKA